MNCKQKSDHLSFSFPITYTWNQFLAVPVRCRPVTLPSYFRLSWIWGSTTHTPATTLASCMATSKRIHKDIWPSSLSSQLVQNFHLFSNHSDHPLHLPTPATSDSTFSLYHRNCYWTSCRSSLKALSLFSIDIQLSAHILSYRSYQRRWLHHRSHFPNPQSKTGFNHKLLNNTSTTA